MASIPSRRSPWAAAGGVGGGALGDHTGDGGAEGGDLGLTGGEVGFLAQQHVGQAHFGADRAEPAGVVA